MQDESFGIIPLNWVGDHWQLLLVHHLSGHWGFPKGHREGDEDPRVTAERELLEETGLHIVRHLDYPPLQESYRFELGGQTIDKVVTYFLAEVAGVVTPQLEEVADAQWFTLADGEIRLTYAEGQALCRKVAELIKGVTP